jgi:cardiolipin synthase
VTGPFLTLPNVLSISRVPLSLLASILLLRDLAVPAAIAALLAVLTDWLDGAVARARGMESEWGRLLDPLADKAGFAFFGAGLAITHRLPPWLLLLVVARDLLIVAGGFILLRKRTAPPRSNLGGKISTCVLAAYMIRQTLDPVPGFFAGLDWLGVAALASILAGLAGYVPRLAARRSAA